MADSTKQPKRYVKGSAKEVIFNNGGSLINIDLSLEDLKKLTANKTGYIKITVAKLKTPDKFGNTHQIYENTFKSEAGAKKDSPAQASGGSRPAWSSGSTSSKAPWEQ